MNPAKKIALAIMILLGIGFLLFIGQFIALSVAFGSFDKDYSLTELKENFEKNKTNIYELKNYFNKIVPKNRFIEIEFDNDETLTRFGIMTLDSTASNLNGYTFLEWNLQITSARIDSVIKPLGWTTETLRIIKSKLDKANCIQIESGEPAIIGFKRTGLGMYSFMVYDMPIHDSLKNIYNDSCSYIMVNHRLVLEYGGGAVANQCFYNMQ